MTKGTELNLADISAVMVGLTLGVCLIALGNVMPRMHEDQEPFKSKWNNIKPKTRRKINQSCGVGLVLCGIISIIVKAISYETNYASEAEFISYNINLKTQQVYTEQDILDMYNINAGYVNSPALILSACFADLSLNCVILDNSPI